MLMESTDQYHFSIFRPRNLHGRKNRNVILTMLLIWAVAVFGFQILLRVMEKPVPEKPLESFNKLWPLVQSGQLSSDNSGEFLNSLLLARGKSTLKAGEQKILEEAISSFTFSLLPSDIGGELKANISESKELRAKLGSIKDEEYLQVKQRISELSSDLIKKLSPYTGYKYGTREASILSFSLRDIFPAAMNDSAFSGLGSLMSLYMTHNQSALTDTIFIGFPFHYFYTAFFLLVMFVFLCIIYNKLIEWRLKKEGIDE